MALLLCNNVATTLSAAITTTGQTSISVTSASGMPAPGSTDWFYLTLSDGAVNSPETAWEIVKVTNVSGTTLTIVRAQDSTTAQTWANGAWIQSRPVCQEIRDAGSGPFTTIGDVDYCSVTQTDTHTAGTTARLACPTANGIYTMGWNVTASAAVAPTMVLHPTLSGALTTTGAYAVTLAMPGAYTYTFPGLTSYLAANPCTTTGDISYASTTATPATLTRLAGSNGVLQSTGAAAPAWTQSPSLVLPTVSTGVTFTASSGGTTAGETWYDTTQKAMASYAQSLKNFLVGCIFTQTATGTNGAATAITNILGTGIGTNVLPAFYSLIGKTLRVRVKGTVTTAASPGTTVITLYFSAGTPVSIIASASITPFASMTSMPFLIEFDATFRTTTTIMAAGMFIINNAATVTGASTALMQVPMATTTAATIVAATSYTVQVCATNGTASGCVYTTQLATIEILA